MLRKCVYVFELNKELIMIFIWILIQKEEVKKIITVV